MPERKLPISNNYGLNVAGMLLPLYIGLRNKSPRKGNYLQNTLWLYRVQGPRAILRDYHNDYQSSSVLQACTKRIGERTKAEYNGMKSTNGAIPADYLHEVRKVALPSQHKPSNMQNVHVANSFESTIVPNVHQQVKADEVLYGIYISIAYMKY